MSTGLIYNPGQFSPMSEIIEMQKAAAAEGGLYATHMRSEGEEILKAIDEAIAVGRAAGCRVEISHFKLPADAAKRLGGASITLGKVEAARAAGLEVWLDQYPYTASSTSISTLIPDEFLTDGIEAALKRLTEPSEVERMVAAMRPLHEIKHHRTHFGYVTIAACEMYPGYAGKSLLQIAQINKLKRAGRHGGDVELLGQTARPLPEVTMEEQYRLIVDIFAHGGASCVFHSMNEEEVETILRNPLVSVASDSGIREFGAGVPHPRGYGTNARVLGHYSRDRHIIPLEEAVRKMTSLPAYSMRLAGRGTIREGFFADLVIFDEARIIDRATFEKPHQYPDGIEFVIVNGKLVMESGKMTGARPGRPIHGPAKP
jgi:N-acyl-D-amino-acid deacylase